jgi:lipoprotein-anchoring transpeptidase ErfK/SrfK
MRRIVAIPVKGGVAVGLWALGALCVAAEVRQPGFWCNPMGALRGRVEVSGERVVATSSNQSTNQASSSKPGDAPQLSVKAAAQNSEVAAEIQASQQAGTETPETTDAHTRLIVISIPDRQLALLEDGEVVKVYPIAVGAKHSPSPEGEYTVINHSVNPTYRHKDKTIEPGKDNPLGTRWMGISLKGYGIHGTNVQSSIGKEASHGCFRMKKKDVEDLYERVQIGDTVSIRGQRDDLTAQLFTTGAPAVATTVAAATSSANKTEAEVAPSSLALAAGGGQ